MRCFIAAAVSEEILKKLARFQAEIAALGKANIVEPRNMHITFKFLGGADTETAEREMEGFGKKKAFIALVSGIGAFPCSTNPRVIWAGVSGYEERLHITLARLHQGGQEPFVGFLDANANILIGEMRIDTLYLKESILTPKGHVYRDIKSVSLRDE